MSLWGASKSATKMMRPTTSASNIHRRALCAGSERMEAGLPDEDSKESTEGSLLHAYDANPKLDRAVLTQYQRDLLRISGECDEFVFKRVEEQFELGNEEPFNEGREEPLAALRATEFETPGHCDRWRVYRTKSLAVIRDAKFGFKEVTPAAANYQLRVYAIATAEEWNVDNVVVAITQPRLEYARRITMAAYTREDIAAASVELGSIREASSNPDAPLTAGPEQCRYCRARHLCPEYQKVIATGLEIVPLDGPPMTATARLAHIERTLGGCTDQQLDKVLLACQFAGFISDPARDEARRRKQADPEALPEWTLGKPQELRKIADTRRAVQLLSLRGDLTRDEILDCCSPKIGELETKLREKTGWPWKQAKECIESVLGPVITREEKRPTLTRK